MRQARGKAQRLWPAQEGAVYAEALVCFPAFVALLLALLGIHGMYAGKLEAKARARRAAWLVADSGDCAQRGCPNCEGAQAQLATQTLDTLSQAQASGRSLGKFTGRVAALLAARSTDGRGEATVHMARAMGGPEARFRGLTTLPCNTREGTGPSSESALREVCDGGLSGVQLAKEACRP